MTPQQVHNGQREAVYDLRQSILEAAFHVNPQRLVKTSPKFPRNRAPPRSIREPETTTFKPKFKNPLSKWG